MPITWGSSGNDAVPSSFCAQLTNSLNRGQVEHAHYSCEGSRNERGIFDFVIFVFLCLSLFLSFSGSGLLAYLRRACHSPAQ